MAGIVTFLFLPFLAGVVLATTPVYVGLRVLERDAILAALTLAQLAALGETIALLSAGDISGTDAWFWSLALTLAGAVFFTLVERWRPARIPRDAVIAIVYATAAAASAIAMSRATGGTEYLKDIIIGNILAVRSTELIETAALYAIIGLLHLVVRGSMGDRLAAPAARYRRWPDFLFHASLAVVLTCAVAIGGVLVAFSYLIVPAIVATLWSKSMTARLVTGWIAGTIVSAAGIALAYLLDLPAGAAIVCASSIVLATAAGMRVVRRGAR